jgi:fatty acid desaturase
MEITESTYRPKFTVVEGRRLYKELHRGLQDLQLFKRSYLFYGLHALFVFTATAVILYFIITTKSTVLLIGLAMLLAMCVAQLGGYMHDTAHRMVFKTKAMNDLAGTFCTALIFINYNAWKQKHAAHHAHPNQEGHDPDLEIPIFSFTASRYASKTGLEQLLRRYQAYLYFPMSVLLGYSLQFKNTTKYFIQNLRKYGLRPGLLGEMLLSVAGFLIWYVLPFFVFDLSKALLLIVIVPVTAGFYIASVFAPNHKGMPVVDRNTKLSFLEQQIITSRNIADNWFTDFVYLSLNYQIEHHLFPDCPRNKLKLVTPHIQELCRAHGLPFTIVSLRESFGVILHGLSDVVDEVEQGVVPERHTER